MVKRRGHYCTGNRMSLPELDLSKPQHVAFVPNYSAASNKAGFTAIWGEENDYVLFKAVIVQS